jgi:hypothetical protein
MNIAGSAMDATLKVTLQQIHLNELDKVKVPFASKHCLQSSYNTIKEQTLKRELKEDDVVIQKARRLTDDEEPDAPGLDTYGQFIKHDRIINLQL